jgi:hypothetical protein
MKTPILLATAIVMLTCGSACIAEIKVIAERNTDENATARFKFNNVPPPAKSDAATKAAFTIVDGRRDAHVVAYDDGVCATAGGLRHQQSEPHV